MNNETFYYWGPYLWKTQVDKDFCDELLKRSKNTNVKHNEHLAGHIDEEYRYLEEDKQWCLSKLAPYLDRYLKSGAYWYRKYLHLEKDSTKIRLINLWINFMKKGEYNPEHTHDEDISFVLYLKIPEILKEENKFVSSSSCLKPGAIEFCYGETLDNFITSHVFLPEETDLFIFPSRLRHMVAPFRSDCVRISVSGNFKIDD